MFDVGYQIEILVGFIDRWVHRGFKRSRNNLTFDDLNLDLNDDLNLVL